MAINTPSSARMSAGPWSRLTPTNSTNNSPFGRATPSSTSRPGASSKSAKNDTGLSLRHVIGTTACAANSIDTLPASNALAFTAGAAAVLASFDDNLAFTQRFYRARPTAVPLNPSPSIYEPSTPTALGGSSDLRRRTAVFARDMSTPNSPVTPSALEFGESPGGGGKTWAAKERVKSATCVSFSPDGKYLAIGETGYKPRVLIFSTSREASPYIPLTSLNDHTFGVKCVAFSPNSQYLASLGTANDGFLYIWNINNRNGSATLYASNKCTSNIYGICWMGMNLVTFGTRHVKLWRLEGSTPSTPVKLLASFLSSGHTPRAKGEHRILAGRNCLLGPLLEGVFTCAVALSRNRALVCSELGDLCLLDDSEGRQSFVKIGDAGFCVTAASLVSSNQVQLAGKAGVLRTIEVDKLLKKAYKRSASRQSSIDENMYGDSGPFIVALAPFGKYSVSVDTNRFIRLIKPLPPDKPESAPEVALQLPAHGGPVLGVRPCKTSRALDATFFTWSAEGTILFWNSDGVLKKSISVEIEQPESQDETINELRVVRLCGSKHLVTGDKCGVLRLLDLVDGKCLSSLRAHAGEITDIAIYEGSETLVASAGRDRTVQVFEIKAGSCELLQTLDEHVGAVTGIVFTPNGKHLLSCSSDRTVVVREALMREENGQSVTAFIILRTVTLKATPVSMTIPHDRDDILWISAVDRNVHRYNLRNGHLSDSFKVTDNEGSDAVVLSSLACVPTYNSQNMSMIAGVSSTDKSIRVYDENGLLLGRDWGHTEGVTDLALINTNDEKDDTPGPASLVTVAADGTVFIWAFGSRNTHKRDLSQSMELMGLNTPNKDLLVNKPPLRRVLSQTEMARFQERSTDDDTVITPIIKKTPAVPTLAKRSSSRFSLAQTPRLDPPIPTFDASGRRRGTKGNSPSPPTSPKSQRTVTRKASNSTISSSARARTRSTGGYGPPDSTTSALATSTDNICRNLRSYRKKLATSSDDLSADTLKSLERELGLTARAVGEKAMKARGVAEETVMVKLLSQYSERLLEMLDEKFAATLARQVSTGNNGGTLTPPDSGGCGEDAMTLVNDERHPSIQEEV
ncbi:uncharacterized protein PV09_07383 [Verruconis gallopava]|uniref:Anaphase-promoting complex subunit 4 WD40 domain-containing protein n=1 Tax=Verruconis gallopava TaxID=253628 RepID=A0A0D1XFY0_9PEZI|nr:uncharacterized protein PV09_07383 [Verruconis gallopava]KIW01096.1 hypothetical protein PV09_07383 [Verruconis gallopava]